MAGMESWAAFSARALEIDIGTGLLDELKNAGISSFGKMAFICAANPNSGDDTPLVEAVEALIGRRPDANDMLPLRRLWYESHAIAISDMKSRLERTAGDAPRQMPLAERMQRLKRQKETLTGLQIDQTLEPAHAVVDKVQSMLEENCLHYLPPDKCVSREQEASKEKPEPAVSFDSSGNIKIGRKAQELSCDVGGELKLRRALTRRSLAINQAGLASFDKLEEWNNHLFNTLMRDPPHGYKYVATQQILTADKEYWTRIAQETRGALQITAGADPPLNEPLTRFMHAPEISCLMTPLPVLKGQTVQHDASSSSAAANPKGSGKKGGKPSPDSDPKKVTAKSLLSSLPEGCQSKLPSGKWLCLFYNKGICKHQKKKQCPNGLHQCYYVGCDKKRPYIECSH